VGFCCPIPGCGSPYLEWHHFDPPWNVKHHNDPAGMIALCRDHHPEADGGAFTVEQLHALKAEAKQREADILGKFNWMRCKLLVVVGGQFHYEPDSLRILSFNGHPVVWLNRDENGMLLLNIRMITASRQPRLIMEDNFWIARGNPIDFRCPPTGRLIYSEYENGDKIRIEFVELISLEDAAKRYPEWSEQWPVVFPVTAVEVTQRIAGTQIQIGPRVLKGPGFHFKHCFFHRCGNLLNFRHSIGANKSDGNHSCIGRNMDCPCGSGAKFKHCCMRDR